MKVIYDFGANNGDDIPYYLLKSDRVVAVEANPELCKVIEDRYRCFVESGRLVVECCVLSSKPVSDIDFFIPKPGMPGLSDHHSTFTDPDKLPGPFCGREKYNKIRLPARHPADLVSEHGEPYYIKIDVEHCDKEILRSLFQSKCFPKYISAESHSIDVFCELVSRGDYNAFKLVDGYSVSETYTNFEITCESLAAISILESLQNTTSHALQLRATYSFPYGSAGPFGEDLLGDWLSSDELFLALAASSLGWKDIHATKRSEFASVQRA